jgi:hypothetical protein
MADQKISALTSATTPLAGTEVLPIVQSGTTKKVSVANLNTFGPAFSYYADGTTQTLSASTYTKILFQTLEFDTASAVSSSRFTPQVAGYYQINAQILLPALAGSTSLIAVYKNGTDFKEGSRIAIATAASGAPIVSALIYCNGSTDYLEIYAQQSSATSQNLAGGANQFLNYFQGFLVRSA